MPFVHFTLNQDKIIHNTFDLRLGSDYQDFLDVNGEEVKEYLSQAKTLINTIEKYLKR